MNLHLFPILVRGVRTLCALVLAMTLLLLVYSIGQAQEPTLDRHDLAGPQGSGLFGWYVETLPNGNLVVTDPEFDDGTLENVGAVFLYDGDTETLISVLKGSHDNDRVGENGIVVLTSGNFVVTSRSWNQKVGAATWVNGERGLDAVLSPANSLVGSSPNDFLFSEVVGLTNGNYVVATYKWDRGAIPDAGAVTWGNGLTGVAGAIGPDRSLVGAAEADEVGSAVIALTNGNYVVSSPIWASGPLLGAGAATFALGTAPFTGEISASNSLVGNAYYQKVGLYVVALTNGNYVVGSPTWGAEPDFNKGAATWGSGATGIAGTVSAANSLVGSNTDDRVGKLIVPLSDGDYVVASNEWNNGTTYKVGAATWGNGVTGTTNTVSIANSLIGSSEGDAVGTSVTALTNGNYVVTTQTWDNGVIADVGAATWGNGNGSTMGVVSAANSLIGAALNDRVGEGVVPLSDGNYVVLSPGWNGNSGQLGAATWADGATGLVGVVGAGNSLIGSAAEDAVGVAGAALPNGGYVVRSPFWSGGGASARGAVTYILPQGSKVGVVGPTNSLIGSQSSDMVGADGVAVLDGGNFVVSSSYWGNGGLAMAGAATWADATKTLVGTPSSANSLVGTTEADFVSRGGVIPLANGDYLVYSPAWHSAPSERRGALTYSFGKGDITGAISAANSVLGMALDPQRFWWSFSESHGYLAVGRPSDKLVTIVRTKYALSVSLVGAGSGTVESTPSGIQCESICAAYFPIGQSIQLTATANISSTFTGWSGACQGAAATCIVPIEAAKMVTATFALREFTFTIGTPVDGSIKVEPIIGADMDTAAVATNIEATYPWGTRLRLTAVPDSGYAFTAWTGALAGQGDKNPVEITVTGALSIGATFTPLVAPDVEVFLPLVKRAP